MGQSSYATDRQGKSIPGKQSQFRMLGEARKPEAIDDELIARCESMLGAIHLCIHLSRFSNDRLANELGIDPGHWTRMMQGRAHFPPNKLVPLMELAGNLAPLQYLSAQCGYRLPAPRVGLKTMEAA